VSARFRASVDPPWSLQHWRDLARCALLANVRPEQLDWTDRKQSELLPADDISSAPQQRGMVCVPKAFLPLAAAVLCHRDARRHALLYRILWRLDESGSALLGRATDPDIHRARVLEKAVNRDTHKMKAFVRFREVPGQENSFVAWFEPENDIVDRVAAFFQRRFAGMHWAILTPYRSVCWDGDRLRFGSGAERSDAPSGDASEALWQTYYSHIFNPARVNPRMMQQEMPKRYWKNLPEAALIPDLLNGSAGEVDQMVEREPQPAKRRIPKRKL